MAYLPGASVDAIINSGSTLITTIKNAASSVGRTVQKWGSNAYSTAQRWFNDRYRDIEWLKEQVAGLQKAMAGIPQKIQDAVWNGIKGFIDFIWHGFTTIGSALTNAAAAPINAITAAWHSAMQSLQDLGPLAPVAVAALAGATLFIIIFIGKRLLNLL